MMWWRMTIWRSWELTYVCLPPSQSCQSVQSKWDSWEWVGLIQSLFVKKPSTAGILILSSQKSWTRYLKITTAPSLAQGIQMCSGEKSLPSLLTHPIRWLSWLALPPIISMTTGLLSARTMASEWVSPNSMTRLWVKNQPTCSTPMPGSCLNWDWKPSQRSFRWLLYWPQRKHYASHLEQPCQWGRWLEWRLWQQPLQIMDCRWCWQCSDRYTMKAWRICVHGK